MSEGKGIPSAPSEESYVENNTVSRAIVNTMPPYPIDPVSDMPQTSPAFQSTAAGNSSLYNQPPPSYQDALSYPISSYQSNDANVPKPNNGSAIPPYTAYPSLPQQYQPMQVNPPAAPIVVAVSNVPVGNCIYCRVGTVGTETDLCCMVCLVILAISTFPFGLLFLCCIPCTAQRRCDSCRRIA